MSRTLQPTILAGRGLVRLKDGSVYVGHVSCDRRLVTVAGRLRVITMVDGESVATYRPARRRTIPLQMVGEIVWGVE